MTFDDIEQKGVEIFLQCIQQELINESYPAYPQSDKRNT